MGEDPKTVMTTYTLYLGLVALACFFSREEAERFAFDLGQRYFGTDISVLQN